MPLKAATLKESANSCRPPELFSSDTFSGRAIWCRPPWSFQAGHLQMTRKLVSAVCVVQAGRLQKTRQLVLVVLVLRRNTFNDDTFNTCRQMIAVIIDY